MLTETTNIKSCPGTWSLETALFSIWKQFTALMATTWRRLDELSLQDGLEMTLLKENDHGWIYHRVTELETWKEERTSFSLVHLLLLGPHRAIFNRISIVIGDCASFVFTSLSDWSRKLVPLSPNRMQNYSQSQLGHARFSRALRKSVCLFVRFLKLFLSSDWPLWLPWLLFYDTRSKRHLMDINSVDKGSIWLAYSFSGLWVLWGVW